MEMIKVLFLFMLFKLALNTKQSINQSMKTIYYFCFICLYFIIGKSGINIFYRIIHKKKINFFLINWQHLIVQSKITTWYNILTNEAKNKRRILPQKGGGRACCGRDHMVVGSSAT